MSYIKFNLSIQQDYLLHILVLVGGMDFLVWVIKQLAVENDKSVKWELHHVNGIKGPQSSGLMLTVNLQRSTKYSTSFLLEQHSLPCFSSIQSTAAPSCVGITAIHSLFSLQLEIVDCSCLSSTSYTQLDHSFIHSFIHF